MQVLFLILPIVLLIAVGWLAKCFNYFSSSQTEAIAKFAYYFAVPALLFTAVATENIQNFVNYNFIIALILSVIIIFIISFIIAKYFLNYNLLKNLLAITTSTLCNVIGVGMPVLVAYLGKQALIPLVFALLFFTIIFVPFLIFSLEAVHSKQEKVKIKHTLLALLVNPLVYAPIMGLIVSLIHIKVPYVLFHTLEMLGSAAIPSILVSLGLDLDFKFMKDKLWQLLTFTGIKIVLFPAIAFGLALLFHLPKFWAISLVVITALPTMKSSYIICQKYHSFAEESAAIISLETILGLISLTIILALLTHFYV